MNLNVSTSFFLAELTSSIDFASLSILFVELISAIDDAFRYNHAVLTPADGTGESGG